MKNPLKNKITAIELEGFQTLKNTTRIEFADLTLLFGPNSAGKSAVCDALEFLKELTDIKNYDAIVVISNVKKWASWLTTSQNAWAMEADNRKLGWRTMRIAAEFQMSLVDPWECDNEDQPWHDPNEQLCFGGDSFPMANDTEDPLGCEYPTGAVRIDFSFSVRGAGELDDEYSVFLTNLVITLNHKEIARLECQPPNGDPTYRRLNTPLDDPYCHFAWISDADFISYKVLEKSRKYQEWKQEVESRDGYESKESFPPTSALHDGQVFYFGSYRSQWNNVYRPVLDEFTPYERYSSELRMNFRDILRYFCGALNAVLKDSVEVVQADRSVPKGSKAFALVDLKYSDGWWPEGSLSPTAPVEILKGFAWETDPHWIDLAIAAHCASLEKALSHEEWGGNWASEKINERAKSRWASKDYRIESQRFKQINTYLSDTLFEKRTYQIQSNTVFFTPLDFETEDPYHAYFILSQPAAVGLHLISSNGIKHEFIDVGSGIPFAIPVLTAITQNGIKFIQQPELHLHPSLQLRLADVFIDSIGKHAGPLVIETHSEHIMLRLLRRIRQTTKLESAPYPLSNQQLKIYYFDPQIDGETIVAQQLATPLGDFYNDWPKGFFAERDEDLFDDV